MAFSIEIDATQLSAIFFNIPGITPAQQPTQQNDLEKRIWPMEPGAYKIYVVGQAYDFTLTEQGVIGYDEKLDISNGGYFAGLGTARLQLLGYPVEIIAEQLSSPRIIYPDITPDWVSTKILQSFRLLPGTYGFRPSDSWASVVYQVTQDGKIGYDADLDVNNDGCFAGLGTTRLQLLGYSVEIIAESLSSPRIIYTDVTPDWVSTQIPQLFQLLPGIYRFQPSDSPALVVYQVTPDGKIGYDADLDANNGGCFTGLGTTRLELLGYPIKITANQLSSPEIIYHNAQPTGEWRKTKDPQAFRLLPGLYNLQVAANYANVSYRVTPQGKIDYEDTLDIKNGGCFSGKESTQLELLGYSIEIIAEKLSTEQIAYPYIIPSLGSKSLQTFRLLPGQYNLQVAAGYATVIYLVTPQGKIDYDEDLDANNGGCFAGLGTTRLELLGYSVEIVADEKLSTPQITYPYIISGWVSGKTKQIFRLLPGLYNLQTPASFVSVVYTVTPQGKIGYEEPLDVSNGGCFAGKETTQLKLIGFSIAVDSSPLFQPQFLISEATPSDEVAIQKKVTFHLLPGAYTIQSISGSGYIFSVTPKGTIDYDETFDVNNPEAPGFFSGSETTTLTLEGYPITLDATPLADAISQFGLGNGTRWLTTRESHTVRLFPSRYGLDLVSGAINGAEFEVIFGGTIDYDSSLDIQRASGDLRPPGYLSGNNTNKLRLEGYAITLDASPLAQIAGSFRLGSGDATSRLPTNKASKVRLLPTHYSLYFDTGAIAEHLFEVLYGGVIRYATQFDWSNGGFLEGNGEPRLKFLGYTLLIDASELSGTKVVLLPFQYSIGSVSKGIEAIQVMPQANLTLELFTISPQSVVFDMELNGTVTLRKSFPFVILEISSGYPLLKLKKHSLQLEQNNKRAMKINLPISIPLPNLDDKSFSDLVDEGKRLIPSFAPSWTDHNTSDPGITFIELFAFITEMLLYRANRITDENKRAFVQLLRGPKYILGNSIDEEIRLAILELRSEQRAVTSEDFKRIAMEFRIGGDAIIARALCLPCYNLESSVIKPNASAHVSLIILTKNTKPDQPPEAESSLCAAIKEYVKPRCLLTTRLHVVSPFFLRISAHFVVYIFADQDEVVMENLVKKELENYFHPLTGGLDKQGWPLGRSVYISDLFVLLDGIDGVDYVTPDKDSPMLESPNNDTRRIVENNTKKTIGYRLEPYELVYFSPGDSKITAVRQSILQ